MFNYLKNFSGVLERAGPLCSLLVSLWECNFCTPPPSLAFALLWGWHWSFCECHLRMILNSIVLINYVQFLCLLTTCWCSAVKSQFKYLFIFKGHCLYCCLEWWVFYQKITYLNSKVFVTTFPSIFTWCEQLFTEVILLQVFNYFLFFKSLILKIRLWVCWNITGRSKSTDWG